jgi:hypothetical protein
MPILTALTGVARSGKANHMVHHKLKDQLYQILQPISFFPFLITTILGTMIATQAGTFIMPIGSLACGLDTRWQTLFSSKNADAIRRVQDALNCCGLHSTVDRAWPFAGGKKKVGLTACIEAFNRTESCFVGWREEERRIAAIIMAISLASWVWEVS